MDEKIERVRTSLQIDEDIDLHIKGWILQRIGWGIMLSLLLLACLGLFGNGVLSERRLSRNGAAIRYDRFSRFENKSEMEIDAENKNGNIELILPAAFLRSFKIENIVPEPAKQMIKNGSAVYQFPVKGRGQVTLYVAGRKHGSLQCTVSVNDTDFEIANFIYP